MKILYFTKEYPTPMYLWPRVHFIDELAHHGIEICAFDALQYETMEQANEECLKEIKTGQYDLFMTGLNETDLFLDTLEQIKAFGVPTLLICFDSMMTPLAHKNVIAHYDLALLSQEDRQGAFDRYHAKTLVSHYAANPFFFKPNYTCSKIPRIAFPGTPYGSRANVINQLIHAEIGVDLYYHAGGSSAPQVPGSSLTLKEKLQVSKTLLQHEVGRKVFAGSVMQKLHPFAPLDASAPNVQVFPPVDLRTTNDIYASHDLSLSVAIARNTGHLRNPVQIVHLRNFEIPMSGGVQICQYFDELAGCFEEDKEIIFYRSHEELADKAKFYLAPEREAQRLAIRQAARKRAEGEHTWFHRFSKAFEALGLTVKEEE